MSLLSSCPDLHYLLHHYCFINYLKRVFESISQGLPINQADIPYIKSLESQAEPAAWRQMKVSLSLIATLSRRTTKTRDSQLLSSTPAASQMSQMGGVGEFGDTRIAGSDPREKDGTTAGEVSKSERRPTPLLSRTPAFIRTLLTSEVPCGANNLSTT